VDQAELVMSERQGVEIDYCPTCRGIWLDRGELDKILDRAATTAPPAPAAPARGYDDHRPVDPRGYEQRSQDQRRYDDGRGYDDRSRSADPRYVDPRRRKKESWLGELFDF
jgi:Zn-finger nucleic acid-binding protein